jgi:hypothetical protein
MRPTIAGTATTSTTAATPAQPRGQVTRAGERQDHPGDRQARQRAEVEPRAEQVARRRQRERGAEREKAADVLRTPGPAP